MVDYTFNKFLNASLRFLAGRHQFLLNKLSRSSGSERKDTEENKNRILKKMAMWVFGYGSLIWKSGFPYDERVVGFIKDYRRVFYQGSTDHRGTPEFPGRTVTLEPAKGEVCWGAAYKITDKQDQAIALEHLEVREKQYDKKAYVDFFTEASSSTPFISNVMVYIASPDKKLNQNYLGPASLEEIAVQIVRAQGPSGPNREYLFKLENALTIIGYEDKHVRELADRVRHILSLQGELVD